ncbi:hypothetical protein [Paenibacillus sp. FSL R7-0652]|uniref:hypothetical protein n=1 Tax=Paenibacillus sp. FSL R7-0652 TaxID=2921687 RepID=UPI00315AA6CF
MSILRGALQVNNGLFESEWFTNNGEGLTPDDYNLRISSTAAINQPESAQVVIGKQTKI